MKISIFYGFKDVFCLKEQENSIAFSMTLLLLESSTVLNNFYRV